jgi:hypothetical protein
MGKESYRSATVRSAIEALKSIARHVEILDADAVKIYLAKATFSHSCKERLSNDLLRFYKYKGLNSTSPDTEKLSACPSYLLRRNATC